MNKPIAIAVYKAENGKECKLEEILNRHAKVLREDGLLSHRLELIMRAPSGHYLEILQWESEECARNAHENPKVQAIWRELASVAKFCTLSDLNAESLQIPFPKFNAVVLESSKNRETVYADNMLPAKNYEKLTSFYQNCFGLKCDTKQNDFTMLIDQESQQRLCITNGEATSRMGAGISSSNLAKTLTTIEKNGGSILKRWEFKFMIGANCHDSEGNEFMVWEIKK